MSFKITSPEWNNTSITCSKGTKTIEKYEFNVAPKFTLWFSALNTVAKPQSLHDATYMNATRSHLIFLPCSINQNKYQTNTIKLLHNKHTGRPISNSTSGVVYSSVFNISSLKESSGFNTSSLPWITKGKNGLVPHLAVMHYGRFIMNKAFQRVRQLKCEACIYITALRLNLLFKNISLELLKVVYMILLMLGLFL